MGFDTEEVWCSSARMPKFWPGWCGASLAKSHAFLIFKAAHRPPEDHPNHPRQSPTILTTSRYSPVFGSPTATLEVVGNTGNSSSEKAGVVGSTPALDTINSNSFQRVAS